MDQEIVCCLEQRIEESVAEATANMGRERLPLLPSQQTVHLIAKAAVTVYETAVEAQTEV
jgi:hypothetical protein